MKKDIYVIAADGGLGFLLKNKLRPDFLVGDLDSIRSDETLTEEMIKAAVDEIPHEVVPVEKDDTDMGLAVAKAYEKGYHEILIYESNRWANT